MTNLELVTKRSLAEFDRLVALREEQLRLAMAMRGMPKSEIDAAIEECRPHISEQRAAIPGMVESNLRKYGIPLQVDENG